MSLWCLRGGCFSMPGLDGLQDVFLDRSGIRPPQSIEKVREKMERKKKRRERKGMETSLEECKSRFNLSTDVVAHMRGKIPEVAAVMTKDDGKVLSARFAKAAELKRKYEPPSIQSQRTSTRRAQAQAAAEAKEILRGTGGLLAPRREAKQIDNLVEMQRFSSSYDSHESAIERNPELFGVEALRYVCSWPGVLVEGFELFGVDSVDLGDIVTFDSISVSGKTGREEKHVVAQIFTDTNNSKKSTLGLISAFREQDQVLLEVMTRNMHREGVGGVPLGIVEAVTRTRILIRVEFWAEPAKAEKLLEALTENKLPNIFNKYRDPTSQTDDIESLMAQRRSESRKAAEKDDRCRYVHSTASEGEEGDRYEDVAAPDMELEMETLFDRFRNISTGPRLYDAQFAFRSGLVSKLYDHQIDGVNWMLKRERPDQLQQPNNRHDVNKWKLPPLWSRKGAKFVHSLSHYEQQNRPLHTLGGLLSDDMGLGKTIQTIALIVANRPRVEEQGGGGGAGNDDHDDVAKLLLKSEGGGGTASSKNEKQESQAASSYTSTSSSSSSWSNLGVDRLHVGSKTTLIVCPLGVLAKWGQEIRRHAKKGALSVLTYHGPTRFSLLGSLHNYDVVLTTYSTLTNDFRLATTKNFKFKGGGIPSGGIVKGVDNVMQTVQNAEAVRRELFDRNFHRIVLDEAHLIRTRSSNVFKTMCSVMATHRWCLSGTPLVNSPEDIQSLLEFLKVEPYCLKSGPTMWKDYISKPVKQGKVIGLTRLRTLMSTFSIRRTKSLLVNATKKSAMRRQQQQQQQRKLTTPPSPPPLSQSTTVSTPTTLSNAAATFPSINSDSLNYKKTSRTSSLNNNNTGSSEFNARSNSLPPKFISEVIIEMKKEQREAYDRYANMVKDWIGTVMDMKDGKKLLASSMGSILGLLSRLKLCCCDPALVQETDMRDMVVGNLDQRLKAKTGGQQRLGNEGINSFSMSQPEPFPAGAGNERKRKKMHAAMRKPHGGSGGVGGENNIHDGWSVPDEEGGDTASDKSSTRKPPGKVSVLLEQLDKMDHENPYGKAVVVSQFKSFLDIVQFHLNAKGWATARIDGSVTGPKREIQLAQFNQTLHRPSDRREVRVMLLSMKAGGVGIDLTEASYVFMLDQWWNPATDMQAIDRVHRIGQKSPVIVKRFIMNNTIEERISELVKNKEIMVLGSAERLSEAEKKRQRVSAMFKLLNFDEEDNPDRSTDDTEEIERRCEEHDRKIREAFAKEIELGRSQA